VRSHPLSDRTPRLASRERKKKKESADDQDGDDDAADQAEAPTTVNPAQLKKEFFAGTLDLLDDANFKKIKAVLLREKVKGALKLVDEAKQKQSDYREFKQRCDASRYKLYPRVCQGQSPLKGLSKSLKVQPTAEEKIKFEKFRMEAPMQPPSQTIADGFHKRAQSTAGGDGDPFATNDGKSAFGGAAGELVQKKMSL